MKKPTKKPTKTSATPPTGWPSKNILKEAERKLKNVRPTKLLPKNVGPVERTKHELCENFIRYRKEQNISQRELANRLDVTENRVSEILHYHHESFTIDRLLDLLSRLKPGISLRVA